MKAFELIANDIPPLKTSDTAERAQHWMSELHVSQLPIVNDQQLLGLITEEDLINSNKPKEPIGNHELSLIRPFVKNTDHIFEVMKLAAEQKLSIIPVVDKDENYLGCISAKSLLHYFAQFGAIKDMGGIIVLEMPLKEYALSEIVQIVESNGALLLGVFTMLNSANSMLEVTLKLNKTQIDAIIAAFQRYDYLVKDSYQEPEYFEDLRDRFDGLMNYLNV